MQVVAHAGAIGRRPVLAVNGQLGALAHGHLRDERHQVVWDAAWVLAHQAAGVRADRIKVTQPRHAPARIGRGQIDHHLLDDPLAAAIGVGGGTGGLVLVDGHALRIAVDRGRGAEDQLEHPARRHGAAQGQAAAHVHVVIALRLAHALAHRLETGKVDHRIHPLPQQALQQGLVAYIAHHQFGAAPRNSGHARQGFGRAVAEVVEHPHLRPGLQEAEHGVRADVARTAGHQHGHVFKFQHDRILMPRRPGGARHQNCSTSLTGSSWRGTWPAGGAATGMRAPPRTNSGRRANGAATVCVWPLA